MDWKNYKTYKNKTCNMVMSKIHSFCDYHLTQHEDTLHLSLLWTTSYKAKNWRTVTFKLAALWDLTVKNKSNCKTDIKYEFLDPKNPRNHILHCSFSQTYAHTFESDTPSSFIHWPSKKTKTLRNEPSLSTVTEVLKMTQLETSLAATAAFAREY